MVDFNAVVVVVKVSVVVLVTHFSAVVVGGNDIVVYALLTSEVDVIGVLVVPDPTSVVGGSSIK